MYNKAFHDLTSGKSIPFAAHQVLGLGLNYVPTPDRTLHKRDAIVSSERLIRQLHLKGFWAGQELKETPPTKLRMKSIWQPPTVSLDLDRRCSAFDKEIKRLFSPTRRISHNLSTFHRSLLDKLMDNDSIVYTNSDKGLGICAIELENYIKWGLKHLTNKTCYEQMTEEQAWEEILQLKQDIFQWTVDSRGEVDDEIIECIRAAMDKSMKDPFAYFYVMPKIHKPGPMGSKTRGVSFDCGSLPHTLGQWVDETLQPIAQSQSLYFPNSVVLKEEYEKLTLKPFHSLFTYDVIEMYPNNPTDDCCERLE